MKLLRPLAGYTLYDHKTNELRITGILGKIDEYRRNWLSHLQRMPQNRTPLKSYHYRPQGRKQLEDRRSVGASSCNSGDGTDQSVQSLMFMMMVMMTSEGNRVSQSWAFDFFLGISSGCHYRHPTSKHHRFHMIHDCPEPKDVRLGTPELNVWCRRRDR